MQVGKTRLFSGASITAVYQRKSAGNSSANDRLNNNLLLRIRLHHDPCLARRQHCSAKLLPDINQLLVTSMGSNVTRVLRRGTLESIPPGESLLPHSVACMMLTVHVFVSRPCKVTCAGSSKELGHGDRIYLLATDASEHITVSLDAAAQLQARPAAEPAVAMQQVAHDAGRQEARFEPAVLMLVGPPGAGKSTFCEELRRRTPSRWQRINQERALCSPRACPNLQKGPTLYGHAGA